VNRDELVDALPAVQRKDYRAVEIDDRNVADQAAKRGVEASTVWNNVYRAKEKLDEWEHRVEHLPEHLTIDDGRIRCRSCRRPISIGTNRVEYGHARWDRRGGDRCPHRPDIVDPDKPESGPLETGDVEKGPDGLFRSTRGESP
jgi:hypothetical protein